jgi:hypothetical protein
VLGEEGDNALLDMLGADAVTATDEFGVWDLVRTLYLVFKFPPAQPSAISD